LAELLLAQVIRSCRSTGLTIVIKPAWRDKASIASIRQAELALGAGWVFYRPEAPASSLRSSGLAELWTLSLA
jgi:hypothetical protein